MARNPRGGRRGGGSNRPYDRRQAPPEIMVPKQEPPPPAAYPLRKPVPTKAEVKDISQQVNPTPAKQNVGATPQKANPPPAMLQKANPPPAKSNIAPTPAPKGILKQPAATPAKQEPAKASPLKQNVNTPKKQDDKQDDKQAGEPEKVPENEGTNGQTKDEENMDPSMDTSDGKSLKRPHPDGQGKEGRVKRKKKEHGPSQPKNALVQLNELKKGLVYVVESQEGPPHNPAFVVTVEVNGEKYVGKGRSKQEGKHAAAAAALASFVQFQRTPEAMFAMQKSVGSSDFTSDNIEDEKSIFQCFTPNKGDSSILGKIPKEEGSPISRKRVMRALTTSENKNPVMVLNELHPGLQYILMGENTGIPTQRFVMSVTVGDDTFEGTGQSKKLAKAAAARSAISKMYGMSLCSLSSLSSMADMPETPVYDLPQGVADKIGQTVFKKFAEVMGSDEEHRKWKVLAGIVMTTDAEMQNQIVVAVSSGTKCIGGEHMSMNGASLNDCHAEIISQRCFKEFLYRQLEMISDGDLQNCVLQSRPGGRYVLKPGIKFHLFISTAPCGDARIFSPHELLLESIDRHPMRKARGLLRSKIEAGEGTIPIKPSDSVQTWDGIIQGQQRLLTMSCSDKLSCWNIVGIQGSLLSYYVEPIYLESIILGSLYHPGHMSRAMYGRIEHELGQTNLPGSYSLHKPKMNMVSSTETRQLNKSPNFSINWTMGMSAPEIINGTTGKQYSGQVSRLTSRSFFTRFADLYRMISPALKHNPFGKKLHMYSDIKNRNLDYQKTKEAIRKAFHEANLGNWVKKPAEQNEFEIEF